MSWYHRRYTVVITSFFIAFSCLKIGLRSCTVGYAVAWFSITWIRSQFSTVHMVKSVQLHISLCNCISWHCDNVVPTPTPWNSLIIKVTHYYHPSTVTLVYNDPFVYCNPLSPCDLSGVPPRHCPLMWICLNWPPV